MQPDESAPPFAAPASQHDELGAMLHGTMDAQVWATEFCRLNNASDKGMMLGWFANAIMAGFDEASRRAEEKAVRVCEHCRFPVGEQHHKECYYVGTIFQGVLPPADVTGEQVYRAMYEHEGGKWDCVETQDVWHDIAARLNLILRPSKEIRDEK